MSQTSGAAPAVVIGAALRRERTRLGVSLTELARRAGVAKSTLSQLEARMGNPSVETLWALAMALDVPLARLLEVPVPSVQIIRAGQGPAMVSERSSYVATVLSSCPPGARRDLYYVQAEPGEPRDSLPHMAGVVEHVILNHGQALVGPTEDPAELNPGDYIAYPGDLPHTFRALAPGTTAVLVSEHR